MKPRPALLLCAFTLLLFSFTEARKWVASDVPNPKLYPASCIDVPAAKLGVQDGEALLEWMWVCNPEQLLSPSTVDAINQELHALSELPQEGCNKGIQVRREKEEEVENKEERKKREAEK